MWSFQSKGNSTAGFIMALAVLFSTMTSLQAQPDRPLFHCGTDEYWKEQLKNDPSLLKRQIEMLTAASSAPHMKEMSTTKRIIPVVFHVIHNYGTENVSKANIIAQLKTINLCYSASNTDTSYVRSPFKSLIADCNIEFRLATKDPNGNCTDGINRIPSQLTYTANNNVKSLSLWDPGKYLNIWVVNTIDMNVGGGTVLGYAQFPWDNSTSTDGIVVIGAEINNTSSHTLTHEIGHYLGLLHTFETSTGSECGANCQSTGDWVCDTPPSANPNFGCPTSTNSCTKDFPDRPDMIENFMDYANCSHLFTLGQKARMDGTLTSISKRAGLITSTNLTATGTDDLSQAGYCKPVADFYAFNKVICEGGSITFYDNSYNSDVTNYQWTFSGAATLTASAQNPTVKFTKAGTYDVKLKVWNPVAGDSATKTALITVLPAVSTIKSPLLVNFNNAASLASIGWTTTSDPMNLGWKVSTVDSGKALYLNNFNGVSGFSYVAAMPGIDLSGMTTDTKLRFRQAYAQRTSASADEFRVQVSIDCGQGFATAYYKTGKSLASTTALVNTNYTPADTEWRNVEIDLSSYKSYRNVVIRFVVKNAGGNNVYIDDIDFGGVRLGISENRNNLASFQVYPNPATHQIFIKLDSPQPEQAMLEVYDVTGKRLQSFSGLQMGAGADAIMFSRDNLNISANGMYYLKISSAHGTYTQKVVVTD